VNLSIDLVKRLIVAGAVLLLAVQLGCGGGGASISISPTSATVPPGQTQQFTASVSGGGGNNNVSWQVNSIIGGDPTVGTISSTGLYTAPITIPSTPTVTITAVPAANTLATATASVTIANAITVTPATATVGVTATQQFSAAVTFSSNTAVTWEVNGEAGGDSTYGTISSTGTYTAPSTVPSSPRVTITAVSQADTTKTATASLLITVAQIVIAPTGVTLAAGAQQGFTATVLQSNINPTWSVTCNSSNSADCGSISTDGIYNAPLAPPPGGSVTITASVPDGSAQTAMLTVPIQTSNATMAGTYVFGLTNHSLSTFVAEAGVISFDGVGDITGGVLDRTGASGVPINITGGTYEIGTDGRGTALLQTASGPIVWQFVMATHSTALVARLNNDGYTSTGSLDLQQASATQPISGKYAVEINGVGSSSSTFAQAASVTADGSSTISRVLMDAVSGTNVQSNLTGNGSYTAPVSTGRGTLTLSTGFGTQNFVYYAVDSTHLKLVETDSSQPAYGDLYSQPAGPFTTSSFNERLAFTVQGFATGTTYAVGGLFTLDGNAAITNRILDASGETVFDTNGVYLVTDATSGRTTATWTAVHGATSQYALYPIAGGGFVMLETDGANVASGLALPQTLANPSTASLVGSLALDLSGTDLSSSSPAAYTGSSIISQTGAWSGYLDFAESNGTTLNAQSEVGSFSISGNGRGVVTLLPTSAALNNSVLILYVLDANHALILESDSNRILTGSAVRQY